MSSPCMHGATYLHHAHCKKVSYSQQCVCDKKMHVITAITIREITETHVSIHYQNSLIFVVYPPLQFDVAHSHYHGSSQYHTFQLVVKTCTHA